MKRFLAASRAQARQTKQEFANPEASPFKVLCDGPICSLVKRGENELGGE